MIINYASKLEVTQLIKVRVQGRVSAVRLYSRTVYSPPLHPPPLPGYLEYLLHTSPRLLVLGDISRSGVRQLVCLQSEGGLTGPAWAGVAQLYICLSVR